MKKTIAALAVASVAVLAVAATVAAAGPSGVAVRERAQTRDVTTTTLGLSSGEIQALRHDGLSLALIAEQQGVDPQDLVEALMARWEARIQARVEAGALTPDEATELRTRLETQARNEVFRTTEGGMQGAAVGAGPNAAGRNGDGQNGDGLGRGGNGAGQNAVGQNGDGTCDADVIATESVSITSGDDETDMSFEVSMSGTVRVTDEDAAMTITGPENMMVWGRTLSRGARSSIDIDAGMDFFLRDGAYVKTFDIGWISIDAAAAFETSGLIEAKEIPVKTVLAAE